MQREEMSTDRRQATRKSVKIPIKYQLDNVVHGVLTQDVSSGGVCFIANHFLPKASRIPLTIAFEFLEYPVQIMSNVAWVSSMPFGDQYKIGMQFQEITPFHKNRIEDFISAQ